MRDFTLKIYRLLLTSLKEQGYTFQTFKDFLISPAQKVVVLRHDVDARKQNSLTTAILEHEMGIAGTYYFRMITESYDENVIRQINDFGHEIGYHYDDLASEKGNIEKAIKSFERNLNILKSNTPIYTICMHGSPLSKFDNRDLWKKYNYKNFEILGEPYFDVDFSNVLYLTDTGRKWDGEKVSIRDKVSKQSLKNNNIPLWKRQKEDKKVNIHSTFDILNMLQQCNLPNQIMLTIHPQRWSNNYFAWLSELIVQNIKNLIKKIIINLSKV